WKMIKSTPRGRYNSPSGMMNGGSLVPLQKVSLSFIFQIRIYESVIFDITGALFAIWRGLILAWDMGFRDVCCETDYHEAFILLKNDTSAANNDVTELTRRIHALMKRSWRVELALIQRTANRVADALAKYAVVQNVDQVEWLIPNDDVKELLKHDFLD
ncbi:hypothetical protein PIB30_076256, partial [Stylosanthes scabra]|nr:hypothetical protein [Stylosanthes scabra]